MNNQDSELIVTFKDECNEHLSTIENDLLALEAAGANADKELVNRVFRAAHSIKGGAGFFDLRTIKDLAHKLENILDLIRSGKMVTNPEITNVLLSGFDRLRELVDDMEKSNDYDVSSYIASLNDLASSYLESDQKASVRAVKTIQIPGASRPFEVEEYTVQSNLGKGNSIYLIRFDLIDDIHRKGRTPLDALSSLQESGEVLDCALDLNAVGLLSDATLSESIPFFVLYATKLDPPEAAKILDITSTAFSLLMMPEVVPEPVAPIASVVPVASAEAPQKPVVEIPHTERKVEADTTIRIQVQLLESLMNYAGELVLARNHLSEAIKHEDLSAIQQAGQRIHSVTSDLQDVVMRTRLQPAAVLFERFPRLVRDLSKSLKKNIRLVLEGKDVEFDKTIIEGLIDPLTHLIRNSCDHGIESPEQRAAQGKEAEGLITLSASYEAGQVIVSVSDDGAGMDPNRIGDSAFRKGFVTKDSLARMNAKEKINLVMLPGFSTSEAISDISGRGVGMDVVKSNVERLGGRIDLSSESGKGTSVRMKLPLTLAIIPALLVSVCDRRYAIPQVAVSELLRISPGVSKNRLEMMGDENVLVLRDSVLPLVRLSEVLGVSDSNHFGEDVNIVVITLGALRYGIVVDELHDTIEIVVKPLGRQLKKIKEYTGATILGDGSVALILDVEAIGAQLRHTEAKNERDDETAGADTTSYLIFSNSETECCAVDIKQVDRVESVLSADLEKVGNTLVLKQDGAAIPVHMLCEAVPVARLPEAKEYAVVLSRAGGKRFGLLGLTPIDSISSSSVLDEGLAKPGGIMGTLVHDNRTLLVIDLEQIAASLRNEKASLENGNIAGKSDSQELSGTAPLVLLAEDSDFFRSYVSGILEEEGYRVLCANDGEDAWESLQKSTELPFAIVSDIEMPRMDGLDFTARLRADSRYSGLPVIALTALASEEDMERAKKAGASEYMVKLDRERLLESLKTYRESAMKE